MTVGEWIEQLKKVNQDAHLTLLLNSDGDDVEIEDFDLKEYAHEVSLGCHLGDSNYRIVGEYEFTEMEAELYNLRDKVYALELELENALGDNDELNRM
ncbi:hypothetical protein 015DV002_218 [Bacillus phage 015DV002]|nr:hypothetical protein 000TH008_229 [Bacillus phage 000TH008]QQO40922.1 hypothetical protein 000TH009_229 [Bacillus phage 000TH009]QQO41172.1 hypothetical protein 015DV002_218 [Bacillus phage 015DV002]